MCLKKKTQCQKHQQLLDILRVEYINIKIQKNKKNETIGVGKRISKIFTKHDLIFPGYISMPSSEEMSNNSSPVPKENQISVNYKLMGIISEIPADKEGFVDELPNNHTNSELRPIIPSKPYVTLLSLEQKARDRRALAIDSHIRDLEDLEFIEQQQPENCSIFLPGVKPNFHESPILTEISSMYDTDSLVDDFSDKMSKIDLQHQPIITGSMTDNSHKNCINVEPLIEGEIKINSAFQIVQPSSPMEINAAALKDGKFTRYIMFRLNLIF